MQFGDIGTYTITPAGLTNPNYSITYVPGELTVTKKPVTLTWTEDTAFVYDGAPKSVTAEIEGLVNSDDVELTYTDNTATDIGDYTATAELSGDSAKNYELSDTGAAWSIAKAQFRINAEGYEGIYDGEAHGVSVSTYVVGAEIYFSDAKLTEEAFLEAAQTEAPTFTDAGTYTVYYCITTKNFETVINSLTVTIDKAEVTVTADAQTKEEGKADPALTYTAEGLLGSDTLTGSLTREEGEEAGTYAITLGTLTSSDNYVITFVSADLTITAKQEETQPTEEATAEPTEPATDVPTEPATDPTDPATEPPTEPKKPLPQTGRTSWNTARHFR